MMKQVVVIVPIYSAIPTPEEQASLRQCGDVLGKHPTCYISPEGLDLSPYRPLLPNAASRRYPGRYFEGHLSYSELCLSPEFYADYHEYEYMLIYQPDCWVFSDQLLDWCGLGYDYVGAPWIKTPPSTRGRTPWLDITRFAVGRVGNGGFSLRRVATMRRHAVLALRLFRIWRLNEDLYWSLVVPALRNLKRPPLEEALRFAFEAYPEECFERNKGRLPFGCHGWTRHGPQFWKQYIHR